MIKCSYDEYDKIEELFGRIEPARDYIPDDEAIENEIMPRLEEYILFLLWIDLTGTDAEYNKEGKKKIHRILLNNLELTEDKNDTILPKQQSIRKTKQRFARPV